MKRKWISAPATRIWHYDSGCQGSDDIGDRNGSASDGDVSCARTAYSLPPLKRHRVTYIYDLCKVTGIGVNVKRAGVEEGERGSETVGTRTGKESFELEDMKRSRTLSNMGDLVGFGEIEFSNGVPRLTDDDVRIRGGDPGTHKGYPHEEGGGGEEEGCRSNSSAFSDSCFGACCCCCWCRGDWILSRDRPSIPTRRSEPCLYKNKKVLEFPKDDGGGGHEAKVEEHNLGREEEEGDDRNDDETDEESRVGDDEKEEEEEEDDIFAVDEPTFDCGVTSLSYKKKLEELLEGEEEKEGKEEKRRCTRGDSSIGSVVSVPAAVSSGGDKRKMLLVFDVDETMVHTVFDRQRPRETEGEEEEGECDDLVLMLDGDDCEGDGSSRSERCRKGGESRDFEGACVRVPRDAYVFDGARVLTGNMISVLRPGLVEALRSLSKTFELGVCSAGLGAYVGLMVSAIDPTGELFGDRFTSTRESRDSHPMKKKRVPSEWGWSSSDTIIVDDQPDMWDPTENYSIIKVRPFLGLPSLERGIFGCNEIVLFGAFLLAATESVAIESAERNVAATSKLVVDRLRRYNTCPLVEGCNCPVCRNDEPDGDRKVVVFSKYFPRQPQTNEVTSKRTEQKPKIETKVL